jgi:hypothetical protein
MTFVRKSTWRSLNQKRAKKRANQRAAKERKRLTTVIANPDYSTINTIKTSRAKPTGFRILITCLDDNESVSFTTSRTPLGLSISPTLAAKKIAMILSNYVPI